jgi:hypothetical protein
MALYKNLLYEHEIIVFFGTFFFLGSYYMHVGALRIANETLNLSRQPTLVVTPELLRIRFGVPFPSVTVCILHIETQLFLVPRILIPQMPFTCDNCFQRIHLETLVSTLIFINGLEVKQN